MNSRPQCNSARPTRVAVAVSELDAGRQVVRHFASHLAFARKGDQQIGWVRWYADYPDVEEWPENIKLTLEKEAIGFFLSGHPFERRGKFFSLLAGNDTRALHRLAKAEEEAIESGLQGRGRNDRQEIILAGMGWGGLPEHVVADALSAGTLVRLDVREFESDSLELFTVRRRDCSCGPVSRALWDSLTSL